MKTAAHSTYTGPGRVCISIGNPRGAPAGYKMFRVLAPTREMLNRGYKQHEFRTLILDKLDARQVWADLHRLTGGAEPVLQCFERPPFTPTNWCHRRIVADWFKEQLGEDVDELTPETRAERDQRSKDRLDAASAPASGTSERIMSRVPIRPLVEAVRAEIDRWWQPILARLHLVRTWSWMGLPDRVRGALDMVELAEWQQLQDRYTAADAS